MLVAAGAVAVCALALPGVSGSFVLLTLGLYEPTIAAVNERDLGYLAAFGTGCVIGLALFVRVLRLLLTRYHRVTLVVMTGLMAGSLRALWPWQTDDRTLRPPEGDVAGTVALAALGFLVVAGVIVTERRIGMRGAAAGGRLEP